MIDFQNCFPDGLKIIPRQIKTTSGTSIMVPSFKVEEEAISNIQCSPGTSHGSQNGSKNCANIRSDQHKTNCLVLVGPGFISVIGFLPWFPSKTDNWAKTRSDQNQTNDIKNHAIGLVWVGPGFNSVLGFGPWKRSYQKPITRLKPGPTKTRPITELKPGPTKIKPVI